MEVNIPQHNSRSETSCAWQTLHFLIYLFIFEGQMAPWYNVLYIWLANKIPLVWSWQENIWGEYLQNQLCSDPVWIRECLKVNATLWGGRRRCSCGEMKFTGICERVNERHILKLLSLRLRFTSHPNASFFKPFFRLQRFESISNR